MVTRGLRVRGVTHRTVWRTPPLKAKGIPDHIGSMFRVPLAAASGARDGRKDRNVGRECLLQSFCPWLGVVTGMDRRVTPAACVTATAARHMAQCKNSRVLRDPRLTARYRWSRLGTASVGEAILTAAEMRLASGS